MIAAFKSWWARRGAMRSTCAPAPTSVVVDLAALAPIAASPELDQVQAALVVLEIARVNLWRADPGAALRLDAQLLGRLVGRSRGDA